MEWIRMGFKRWTFRDSQVVTGRHITTMDGNKNIHRTIARKYEKRIFMVSFVSFYHPYLHLIVYFRIDVNPTVKYQMIR